MRTYQLGGSGIDSITLSDKSKPSPAAGQILVRMHAASLNYRDLMLAKRLNGIVPLSDGAGEVVEVGPGVSRVAVGDRVSGIFYQTWIYGRMRDADLAHALGGTADGVLAEYRLFDAEHVVKIPDGLSWHEAATLPCAAVTAWHALQDVRAGETVLILGTGGVSLFALQFAVASGARVIATSSSDKKREQLQALGASDTINYRTHADWEKSVRELTAGEGVDHVVEVGGGGTLAKSIAAARRGGHIHLIGILSGGTVDPTAIMMSGLHIHGIQVGSREMFEAMNAFVTAKNIRPIIDRAFAFDQTRDAYQYLSEGGHMGKVVIDIP